MATKRYERCRFATASEEFERQEQGSQIARRGGRADNPEQVKRRRNVVSELASPGRENPGATMRIELLIAMQAARRRVGNLDSCEIPQTGRSR